MPAQGRRGARASHRLRHQQPHVRRPHFNGGVQLRDAERGVRPEARLGEQRVRRGAHHPDPAGVPPGVRYRVRRLHRGHPEVHHAQRGRHRGSQRLQRHARHPGDGRGAAGEPGQLPAAAADEPGRAARACGHRQLHECGRRGGARQHGRPVSDVRDRIRLQGCKVRRPNSVPLLHPHQPRRPRPGHGDSEAVPGAELLEDLSGAGCKDGPLGGAAPSHDPARRHRCGWPIAGDSRSLRWSVDDVRRPKPAGVAAHAEQGRSRDRARDRGLHVRTPAGHWQRPHRREDLLHPERPRLPVHRLLQLPVGRLLLWVLEHVLRRHRTEQHGEVPHLREPRPVLPERRAACQLHLRGGVALRPLGEPVRGLPRRRVQHVPHHAVAVGLPVLPRGGRLLRVPGVQQPLRDLQQGLREQRLRPGRHVGGPDHEGGGERVLHLPGGAAGQPDPGRPGRDGEAPLRRHAAVLPGSHGARRPPLAAGVGRGP
mmetsp:Transcript_1902/g.5589  ORF Transcript_1902/g.5589 Transcript_1902/m.5589 type:complete len:483 (-) Transcript_1902:1529-2977(-)